MQVLSKSSFVSSVLPMAFGLILLKPSLAFAEYSKVASASEGACLTGACFAPKVIIDNLELSRRGIALFEYYRFDVYTAAFFAEPDVDSIEKALADRPKYLVLEYHRSLEKQNIIDNSEHILAQNKEINLTLVKPGFDQLYKLYRDVKPGDRYSLLYVPGKGTTLFFNGQTQGTVPGFEFHQACFGIWLSKFSVDKDFTQALLKNGGGK